MIPVIPSDQAHLIGCALIKNHYDDGPDEDNGVSQFVKRHISDCSSCIVKLNEIHTISKEEAITLIDRATNFSVSESKDKRQDADVPLRINFPKSLSPETSLRITPIIQHIFRAFVQSYSNDMTPVLPANKVSAVKGDLRNDLDDDVSPSETHVSKFVKRHISDCSLCMGELNEIHTGHTGPASKEEEIEYIGRITDNSVRSSLTNRPDGDIRLQVYFQKDPSPEISSCITPIVQHILREFAESILSS